MIESGFRAEVYEDETRCRPIFRCVRNLVMQDRKADRSIKTFCDGRGGPVLLPCPAHPVTPL
jgi:hypothetical protein